ncbi:hypothetical protein PG997_014731 [Apiospora hydei]|uniref:Uncharacterized protein n=1 Tax=Apiospora hydei TaxID=1337664 RepID=A0ABR1UUN8_9PEZI
MVPPPPKLPPGSPRGPLETRSIHAHEHREGLCDPHRRSDVEDAKYYMQRLREWTMGPEAPPPAPGEDPDAAFMERICSGSDLKREGNLGRW